MTSTVLGTCHHDCPDSCGWVATVDDGVAIKLRGNPAHPFSKGELCPKVNRFLDRVYSPDRLLHPLVRVGPKGEGRFEQATWDDVLALVAERMTAAIDRRGGATVLGWSSAGNQSLLSNGGLWPRFFDAIGASMQTGSLCGNTAKAGTAATYGDGRGMDPMDLRHSRLILVWGTNTRMTNRHLWPFIEEARAAGARVVVIDPVRTITADSADDYVQLRPGTDAALALGMMHVLVRDDIVDHDYVERHTTGFPELAERVAAWTPERTAAVCGLDAGRIEQLARDYGTIRPAAIRTLIGMEHREHGGMQFRAVACLPLLTGAWREKGGGYCRSVGVFADAAVDATALGPVSAAPADRPPRRRLNMNHLGRSLTDPAMDPPIDVLLVWNGNPMVSVPNRELIREGLLRDDLFCVVHEQFMTDTARYADVVVPATTQLEQRDVVTAWGHLYLGWNEPAIAPRGEAVSNTELFRRLAGALGLSHPSLFDADDDLLRAALAPLGEDDLAALRADGFVRLPLPEDLLIYAEGGFATSDGRARLYSPELEARGLDPLPDHVELPAGDDALPLVLLTTKSHTRFLNTSYSHLPKHGPAEGAPRLEITAEDAAARGIADGDEVRIWNERGELKLPARISTVVGSGVVSIPFGWWEHQYGGGVANSLTNDTIADLGGGVAFHDTRVDVAPA